MSKEHSCDQYSEQEIPRGQDGLELTPQQVREIAEIIRCQKRHALANERPALVETRMQPIPTPAGDLEFSN